MPRYLFAVALLSLCCLAGCHSSGSSTPSKQLASPVGAAHAADAPLKPTGNWTEFVSQTGKFRVQVPETLPPNPRIIWTAMKRDVKQIPALSGQEEITSYELHLPDCDYTVVEAPQSTLVDSNGKPQKQDLSEMLKVVVTQLTATGHLVSTRDVKLKNVPGKEYELDIPTDVTPGGATLKGRVFFVNGHIYQVAAQMHRGVGRIADADRFLHSFQVIE